MILLTDATGSVGHACICNQWRGAVGERYFGVRMISLSIEFSIMQKSSNSILRNMF